MPTAASYSAKSHFLAWRPARDSAESGASRGPRPFECAQRRICCEEIRRIWDICRTATPHRPITTFIPATVPSGAPLRARNTCPAQDRDAL